MRLFKNPFIAVSLLVVLLLLSSLASLAVGALPISVADILASLTGQASNSQIELVVTEIRLPRLILGLLVGAGLGIAGAAMQGLFRNPLAGPSLVGVSSGAALFAVIIIVLGSTTFSAWMSFWGIFSLPMAAFLGGGLVTWLIYLVASKNGQTDVSLMLLTGIAINAIAGSATGLLVYFATDEELRNLTFWTLGSIASATWQDNMIASIPILIAIVGLPFFARSLNAFSMGEAVSTQIGFNIKKMKMMVITLTAMAVGAAVSVSGIIGFVGLVAPHLVRLLLGPDHRWLLPASAILGALLVVLSDMLARSLLAPTELPLGIIMSAVGGPFFLWLLLKRRSRVGF